MMSRPSFRFPVLLLMFCSLARLCDAMEGVTPVQFEDDKGERGLFISNCVYSSKCPRGHSLIESHRSTRSSSFQCDVCGQSSALLATNRRWGCPRDCDWDMCHACKEKYYDADHNEPIFVYTPQQYSDYLTCPNLTGQVSKNRAREQPKARKDFELQAQREHAQARQRKAENDARFARTARKAEEVRQNQLQLQRKAREVRQEKLQRDEQARQNRREWLRLKPQRMEAARKERESEQAQQRREIFKREEQAREKRVEMMRKAQRDEQARQTKLQAQRKFEESKPQWSRDETGRQYRLRAECETDRQNRLKAQRDETARQNKLRAAQREAARKERARQNRLQAERDETVRQNRLQAERDETARQNRLKAAEKELAKVQAQIDGHGGRRKPVQRPAMDEKMSEPSQKYSRGSNSRGYTDPEFGDTMWRRPAHADSLFGPSGPQLRDVRQINLGNCYLMASIASVADRQPAIIRNMIRPSGPGRYEVDLHFQGKMETIIVDDRFPPFKFEGANSLDISKHIWFALVEKAFAKKHGSYRALKSGICPESLISITGEPCFSMEVEELELKQISNFLNKEFCVTAGGTDHAFCVSKIEGEMIEIYEPNSFDMYTRAQAFGLGDCRRGPNGMFKLHWSKFQRYFSTKMSGGKVSQGAISVVRVGEYEERFRHTKSRRGGHITLGNTSHGTSQVNSGDVVFGVFRPSQRQARSKNEMAYGLISMVQHQGRRTNVTLTHIIPEDVKFYSCASGVPTSDGFFLQPVCILNPGMKPDGTHANHGLPITTVVYVRKGSAVARPGVLKCEVKGARSRDL